MAEESPISQEATQPKSTGGADLDALLRDFDTATAKPEVETVPAAQLGRAEAPANSPDVARADETAAPNLDALLNDAATAYQAASVTQPPDVAAELRGKLEPLVHAVAAINAQREAAQNKTDWENVLKHGKEAVAGFDHLPADFAETWLMAESIRNPQLRDAFDNRYSSEQAKHWAETRFKKAMQSLYKAAQSVPDRQATEDRAAVTAAVRGSLGRAPEPAPPNYGSMTDAEFTKEKARHGL